MTKSQTLPPDITVTRADVLALPICGGYRSGLEDYPSDGHVWTLALVDDRCVWVEAPEDVSPNERARYANDGDGDGTGWLTDREAAIAERAFLWQTALASDAALADIGNDPAPSAPSSPTAAPVALADPAFWQGVAIGHGEALDSPDTMGGAFPENDKRDPVAVARTREILVTIRKTLAEETRKALHDLRMAQAS